MKKILLILLIHLYTPNKAAEARSCLSQNFRNYGTVVNEEMEAVIADDLSNITYLLNQDLQTRERQARKKGKLRDRILKEMRQVSEDVIKHFEHQNLKMLLEKHQELETARKLLTQFRAKNAEINTSLKATKDFFGGRSAENKNLLRDALLELSTLKNDISTIVTRTYDKEKTLREQQLANLRFITEAKAFITNLNGNSENGIRSINDFDRGLTRKINLYLMSPLVEESDKEKLILIENYIDENFDFGYEFLFPLGNDTDYYWTRKR
jgi:hypothetical protein